jgi:predicted dithiol-disulfide oxidoreductase (DUF899 family)
MQNHNNIELDFVIDRLTNSIQNTVTKDSFMTEVSRLTVKDIKAVSKRNGWLFDWETELNDNTKEVFKLTILNNSTIIQGVISLSNERDHIFMNLLESAPFNKGNNKMYDGVAGNLVAYACKMSFQQGFDGFVVFTAKTALIQHYINTLGAYILVGQRMYIPTHSSQKLVDKYFKNK